MVFMGVKIMSEVVKSGKAVLEPGSKIYYQGRWIDVSEIVTVKKGRARLKQARVELARRVVSEILRSPRNCIRRAKLMELSRQVAEEMGLKRLGYRFLLSQGIIGRPPGSKLYFLTEKAKEMFPDLFPK